MIIGIGNDTIDIRRVEKVLVRHGERFTLRIFTDIEVRKSERRYLRAASYAKHWLLCKPISRILSLSQSKDCYGLCASMHMRVGRIR